MLLVLLIFLLACGTMVCVRDKSLSFLYNSFDSIFLFVCFVLFLWLLNVPVVNIVHIRDGVAMTCIRAATWGSLAATLAVSHPVTEY